MTARLTVGIATLDRTPYAIQTVRGIQPECEALGGEIIVVDQTPEDAISADHRAEIESLARSQTVTWRFSDTPGLTRARNQILDLATGPYIVFVDDDVLTPPNFLAAHIQTLESHDEVLGVAGPTYHRRPDASPDQLTLDNPTAGVKDHFTKKNKPDRLLIGWHDIMVGCNHSIKAEPIKTLGGYDEGIVGGYCEDSDISRRIQASGLGCLAFNPDAWLIHLRAPSGGCRLTNNLAHSERDKLSGFCIYLFRHVPRGQRARFLWTILRAGPLRKENAVAPRRWPAAWKGFAEAFWDAFRHKRRVRSPFATPTPPAHGRR